MAIRFLCAACSQPIEVDDGWASRLVACPYCRKTVTAPSQSTLTDFSAIPVASALGASRDAVAVSGGSLPARSAGSNPLALVAFGLSCLMMALLAIFWITVSAHTLELADFEREFRQGAGDSASQLNAMMEYARRHGGQFPRWLIAAGLLQVAVLALCVAAATCGVLAVRHKPRRGLAIVALVGSGAILLVMGVGFIQAVAAANLHG